MNDRERIARVLLFRRGGSEWNIHYQSPNWVEALKDADAILSLPSLAQGEERYALERHDAENGDINYEIWTADLKDRVVRIEENQYRSPGEAAVAAKQILNALNALSPSGAVPEGCVSVADWRIVTDQPVLIYVVHDHAQYEPDEKTRLEKWESWHVGRWIDHNNGGWMWHGMLGRITHVAPLPPHPEGET